MNRTAAASLLICLGLASCATGQPPAPVAAYPFDPYPVTKTAEPVEAVRAGFKRKDPVERVVGQTANRAAWQAGSAASMAVRVTGNPMVDSLLSGAVRDSVNAGQQWWRTQP